MIDGDGLSCEISFRWMQVDRIDDWPWTLNIGSGKYICHSIGAKILPQPTAWWRHELETFPRYLLFVQEIHRSPVNSPHKGQWRRASMFSLICAWTNAWVNSRYAGDLRSHRTLYEVTVIPRNKTNWKLNRNGTNFKLSTKCQLSCSVLNSLRPSDSNMRR